MADSAWTVVFSLSILNTNEEIVTCGTSYKFSLPKQYIIDEEYAYFTRKLKIGKGKFKGKLPLMCFGCGEVGNFEAKCPNKVMATQKKRKALRNSTRK